MRQKITLSWPVARVALIEINNPPVNALSGETLEHLNSVLNQVFANEELRAAILTGSGKLFSGGADLKEAAQKSQRPDYSAFKTTLETIVLAHKPVIASINGQCVGAGLELALCCDLRVAAKNASFVCAGVNVGLLTSAYRLPRLIGESRAKAMLLTGRSINAETAEKWGLVTDLFDFDDLRKETVRLAHRIATRAPLAVEANKKIVNATYGVASDAAADLESAALSTLLNSLDYKEALAAFTDRRDPIFKGC
jgi:enoyl-CoA hydratase